MEFQNSGVVDENGYTKHTFTHAFSYVAVISDGIAGDYSEDTAGGGVPVALWVALIAIVICTLGGLIFFVLKRRNNGNSSPVCRC